MSGRRVHFNIRTVVNTIGAAITDIVEQSVTRGHVPVVRPVLSLQPRTQGELNLRQIVINRQYDVYEGGMNLNRLYVNGTRQGTNPVIYLSETAFEPVVTPDQMITYMSQGTTAAGYSDTSSTDLIGDFNTSLARVELPSTEVIAEFDIDESDSDSDGRIRINAYGGSSNIINVYTY